MRCHPADADAGPNRAELVAYVDGQLDALTRRRVELWLALHPETATVVEEHRELLDTYRAAIPPEPTEETWRHTFAGIEAALPTRSERRVPRRRLGALLSAAAALLVLIPGDFGARPAWFGVVPYEAEPILVAAAAEVEIVSIDAADLKALLVGQSPWRGPLELVVAGDVELNFAEAGESGWLPNISEQPDATPMYLVPMRPSPEEKR